MKIMKWKAFSGRIFSSGRMARYLRALLFVDAAVLLGIYLAMKLFFPGDFVLDRINAAARGSGISLSGASVSWSPFVTLEMEGGTLNRDGEKLFSFDEITLSPSIGALLGGSYSGDLSLNNFDGMGGEVDLSLSFEHKGKRRKIMEGCGEFSLDDIPLNILRSLLPGTKIRGRLGGEMKICSGRRYDGNFDITGTGLSVGGKVETAMGPMELDRIDLGKLTFKAEMKKNRLDIEKLKIAGLFDISITGKIMVNNYRISASRLDLDIDIKERQKDAFKKISILEIALAQYKKSDEKGNDVYKLSLKGSFDNPVLRKQTKSNRRTSDRKQRNRTGNNKRGKK